MVCNKFLGGGISLTLCRFVERFRKAPPTRREDRGREFSWELQSQSTPGSEVKCHTTPQSSTTGVSI